VVVRATGYGIAEAGVTVNGQSAGILLVLVFGAGTDYALLLVARYREELRRHEDRHEAMAIALRRAGPAILASAATNVAALMCLLIAEVNGTSGLGPIGAMGIAVAMVAILTALPAFLVIVGRTAFWPFVPRFGAGADDHARGAWRRFADRIGRRPRRVWIGTTAVLAVMCIGVAGLDTNLTSANDFREDVESVRGQELISRSFPGGANAPTSAIVADLSRVDAVRSALEAAPGVASLGPVERGEPGARFDVTLEAEPYSREAYDLIPRLRDVAKSAGGDTALIGGPTAEEADFRDSASRDNLVVIPIVLVVVLAILAVLLRAIAAPLLLVATVVVSFLAALGISAVVFDVVFGFPGESPTLPLFAFIFLVALGVDYNIFLMARVREEAQSHGTREGMLHGLSVTGGVITAAGIVLAGTFSVLGVLPLVTLTEIGFVVAFGVLLDTFVVRSILVPALVLDAGRRTWWPSALSRIDWTQGPGPASPSPEAG
jgi:RND superfamily putative drug exporter